jgi:hypothetical protein
MTNKNIPHSETMILQTFKDIDQGISPTAIFSNADVVMVNKDYYYDAMDSRPVLEALDEYRKELGVVEMTIQNLISSHRFLRSEASEDRKSKQDGWNTGFEVGKKLAYEEVKNNQFINVDDLRKMTLEEIMERIGYVE